MLVRTLLVGLVVCSYQVFGASPDSRPVGLRFEPTGSTAESAEFRARGVGYALRVRSDGFQLALSKGVPSGSAGGESSNHRPIEPPDIITARLPGSEAGIRGQGKSPLSSHSNYLIGRDPAGWRTRVPHFGRVHFDEVYPGIDITYYSNNGRLEFDFLVAPGADPRQIRMAFEGAAALRISDAGDLIIATGGEEITQRKPQVFQTIDGERLPIDGGYALEDGEVRFALAPYDETSPLLIDPVVDWVTFLGGSGNEQIFGAAIDDAGFAYVGGFTTGPADFPVANALNENQDGTVEGFIAKLSPDGTELLFSTFLGGSLREQVNGLDIDEQGNIYVSGQTESTDFPTTEGAYQPDLDGPVDGFVTKLTSDGSSLVYSTYLGGPGAEAAGRMRVDGSGNAYVMGTATGPGFPVTPGAFQTELGGMNDAFVAKLNPAGTDLVWASYFGGNFNETPWAIDVTSSGQVALGGQSRSSDFPGTQNAFQPNPGGFEDGFVAVFSVDGSAVDYFSYIGGTVFDSVRGVAFDDSGNIWAGGGTTSMDLPTTNNAENPDYLGGSSDAWLARLPLSPQASPPEPMVTYAGDDLQNFGLDLVAAPSAGGAALRPKGFNILGFHMSISNFAEAPMIVDGQSVEGSFGRVTEFAGDGTIRGTAIIPFSDGTVLAGNSFGTILYGGIGLPDAPTTPGVIQPDHAGGEGTNPADAIAVAIKNPTSTGAALEINQTVVTPLICPAQRGKKFAVFVEVLNFGTVTAVDTVIEFDTSNLNGVFVDSFDGEREVDEDTGIIRWRLGDLAPGERRLIELDGKVGQDDSVEVIGQAFAANATRVTDRLSETIPDEVRLEVKKELMEPSGPNPVLEVGQTVRYRVMVTNTDDFESAHCLELYDFPGDEVTLTEFELETPKPGTFCELRTSGAGYCRTQRLGARESCTVVATGTVTKAGSVATNKAVAAAKNAKSERTVVSTPITVGGVPVSESTDALCDTSCDQLEEDTGIEEIIKSRPRPAFGQATSGSCLPAGVPFLEAGVHDLKLTPGRISFGCWVRDDPSKGALPGSLTASFNAEITNARNPDGTLQGAALALANSGLSVQVPVRLGDNNRTITVDGFSADVVNQSLGGTLVGLQFDGRDVFAAKGFNGSALTSDLRLQAGSLDIEMAGTNLPLVPRDETTVGARAETDGDFVRLVLTLNEGFAGAWSRDGTRLVTRIGGLPPGAAPEPFINCLQNTPDDPRFEPIDLLRVDGADANGLGGTTVSDCGASFTPQVQGDGSVMVVWEFSDSQDNPLPDTGRIVEWESRWSGFDAGTNLTIAAGLGPYATPGQDPAGVSTPLFDPPETLTVPLDNLLNRRPLLSEGGVANAASLTMAGTGLNAIFGLELADGVAQATAVPLPTELGGVQVLVNAVPDGAAALEPRQKADGPPRADQFGGVFAPLLFAQPTQINFQLPWELDLSSGFVDVTVIRNGQASLPMRVPVNAFSPGIFSFDFRPGRAIVTNLDNTLAQPVGGVDDFGLTARPARIGDFVVILATGLGPVNPPALSGNNSLDSEGTFIQRDLVEPVRVFVGGVEATVVFAGLSPQFVGVYQLNVQLAEGTPVGDQVSIVIEVGGIRSRDDVTIAVAP